VLPVVAWRFRRRAPVAALVALAAPVVLVAPWLADNELRYHALTSAAIVQRMQDGLFNPGNRPYGVGRLLDDSKNMLTWLLPDEWNNAAFSVGGDTLGKGLLHVIRAASVAWLAMPLGLWLWRGPRRAWMLVVPLVLGVLLLWIETAAERLFLLSPRYVYPLVPTFGVGCGLALCRTHRARNQAFTADRRSAIAVMLVSALTASLVALWLYLVIAVPPAVNT
jgi:hypothetical protein